MLLFTLRNSKAGIFSDKEKIPISLWKDESINPAAHFAVTSLVGWNVKPKPKAEDLKNLTFNARHK